MKRVKLILCISLVSMIISPLGYATKPSIPSLKMEMSIIQDGNWEVGKENTVTFKFKPLEEVPHKTKHPDEAVVTFDSGLVLVSGNPSWSGFLEKGREYGISVVLRPTKPGKLALRGGVQASLSKIFTDEELRRMEEESDRVTEQSPELKRMGIRAKYPKKAFYYHNGKGLVIDVKGQATDQPQSLADSSKNILIIKSLRDLGPPPNLTEGPTVRIVPPESAIYSDSIKRDTIYRPR